MNIKELKKYVNDNLGSNEISYRNHNPYITKSTVEPDVFIIFIGEIIEGSRSTHTIAFSIDTSDNNRVERIFNFDDVGKVISEKSFNEMNDDLKNKINEFKIKTFDELNNFDKSSKSLKKFKL